MKPYQDFLTEAEANRPITPSEFKEVDTFANRLFRQLNMEVAFSYHFLDRVNDPRNRPAVTVGELLEFFKKVFIKYGRKLAKMPDKTEGVLTQITKDLNLPFAVKYDRRNNEIDLLAITVMRKRNFHTNRPSDVKLAFEMKLPNTGEKPGPAVKVEMWHDKNTKSWVVQKLDSKGNQIGDASYVATKDEAKKEKTRLEKEIK